MTALILHENVLDDQDLTTQDRVIFASSLAFQCELLLTMMGLLDLGYLENILANSAVEGFVTGIACVVIIGQQPSFLGFPEVNIQEASTKSTVRQGLYVLDNLKEADFQSFFFCLEQEHWASYSL